MTSRTPISPIDPRVEMFQRGQPKDSFFNMKALAPRPISEATEMFDTDFEDGTDYEDDSPRLSLNSTGRTSETTLSSFEEIHTPSPEETKGFNFDLPMKPVEGPIGPHLFRSSTDSELYFDRQDDEEILGMSPVTRRLSRRPATQFRVPEESKVPEQHRPNSSLTRVVESLNLGEVARWSARQVARWIYEAGFDPLIAERFKENDISGAVLITLKFEDLRELDIPSFGQRTKLWNELHVLRGSARSSPKPPTPFDEDAQTTAERQPIARRSSRRDRSSSRQERPQSCASDEDNGPRRRRSSRRHHHRQITDDVITPGESVSIVGIEQLMPRPHRCPKGENCKKWRKQQRLIENFKKEHPIDSGGSVWIAGDPGNASTAESVRPFSDAVPSVVASSDVLGPTIPAFRYLEEASLQSVQTRDPQDNVKQFIKFQHMDSPKIQNWSPEEPAPYEMFPTLPAPISGLRSLPKLSIPPPRPAREPIGEAPPRSASGGAQTFSPYRMDRAEALSPDLRTATKSPATALYRFGTPFSEMDVPLTAVYVSPVTRDYSQSVPPDMSYRQGPPISGSNVTPIQRTQSRSSRRPSVAAMPPLHENVSTSTSVTDTRPRQLWSSTSMSSSARTTDDITHAGWMKKRKTKMLRHEWHEHHFTLRGTTLRMHKDARALETLEHIDIDDYAIACSSLASGSKLNAAFKAMNISRPTKDKDEAAFSFQLIPAVIDKGQRLRKRDSTLLNGIAGKGDKIKTHHFAVKSRDERIDWMRELMLAKALKQKNDGYEISVNGNMI